MLERYLSFIRVCRLRLSYLIQRLEKAKIRIVIPTRVLSEILTYAGAAGLKFAEALTRSTVLKVMPFDEHATVEVASMTRAALRQRDNALRCHGHMGTGERQIVAIVKVAKVSALLFRRR